jgi:ABC-type uncharacterized transport system auxiliary subunit
MFRSVLPVLAMLVGLFALAGCAAQAQPVTAFSLAEQARHAQVAEAPPTDFEFEMKATDTESPRRFSHDKELTSSLHASSPTHASDQ